MSVSSLLSLVPTIHTTCFALRFITPTGSQPATWDTLRSVGIKEASATRF